jgi:hypothetical protein
MGAELMRLAEFIGGPKDGEQMTVEDESVRFVEMKSRPVVFYEHNEPIKPPVFTDHEYKLRKQFNIATRLPNGCFAYDYAGESK